MIGSPRLTRDRTHRIKKIVDRFRIEFGREPSNGEIFAQSGLNEEDFSVVMADLLEVSVVSLSRKFFESDSGKDVLQEDFLKATTPAPANIVDRQMSFQFLMERLNKHEQCIMIFYYVENLTMKEIGEILGLTEGRISQLHRRIIQILRAQLSTQPKDDWVTQPLAHILPTPDRLWGFSFYKYVKIYLLSEQKTGQSLTSPPGATEWATARSRCLGILIRTPCNRE